MYKTVPYILMSASGGVFGAVNGSTSQVNVSGYLLDSPVTYGIETVDYTCYKPVVRAIQPWGWREEVPPITYWADCLEVVETTVTPYVFYCDSVSWTNYPTEDDPLEIAAAKLKTRDTTGIGTKKRPFRNLSYMLERLDCMFRPLGAFTKSHVSECKECAKPILIKVAGSVDYPVGKYTGLYMHNDRYDYFNTVIFDFSEAQCSVPALHWGLLYMDNAYIQGLHINEPSTKAAIYGEGNTLVDCHIKADIRNGGDAPGFAYRSTLHGDTDVNYILDCTVTGTCDSTDGSTSVCSFTFAKNSVFTNTSCIGDGCYGCTMYYDDSDYGYTGPYTSEDHRISFVNNCVFTFRQSISKSDMHGITNINEIANSNITTTYRNIDIRGGNAFNINIGGIGGSFDFNNMYKASIVSVSDSWLLGGRISHSCIDVDFTCSFEYANKLANHEDIGMYGGEHIRGCTVSVTLKGKHAYSLNTYAFYGGGTYIDCVGTVSATATDGLSYCGFGGGILIRCSGSTECFGSSFYGDDACEHLHCALGG